MAPEIARLNAALEGRYSIEREIGRGGMAVVYLARDVKHFRNVALKLLDREIISEIVTQRFLREIGIAARLQHPHILSLFDSGEADGRPFFVMPFVEGSTLRTRLDQQTRLPIAEAVRIACEIADALAYAHNEGVVHRDIKPENILLARYAPGTDSEERFYVLIADFGIAKALGASVDRNLTGTGLAIGTAVYMSPEQLTASQDIDGRTDQYSLGCVLYEMLARKPPFSGGSAQASVARRFTEGPPSICAERPEASPVLDRVLMQAMATEPAGRFADACQFRDALLDSTAVSNPIAIPVATLARSRGSVRRNWLPIAAAAAGVVIAVGAAIMYWPIADKPGVRSAAVTGTPAVSARTTIAVLPFTSYDPNGSGEYLADGMTEELINALGKVPELQVTS